MARRRKQTNDPRQLSLFDVMANQIEEIRAENIQDDMREEAAPPAQAEQAQPASVVPEPEQHQEFSFPTNDKPERTLLGLNGNGESVYEVRDGSRMHSRNPEIMQFLDGEKRTPEKLFEAGVDEYLTVQEIHHFTHTLSLEAQHARQANLSAGNRTKGSQARNDSRSQKRGVQQFGILDSGQMGAEQPGKTPGTGDGRRPGLARETGSAADVGEANSEQRISQTGEPAGDVGLRDIAELRSRNESVNFRITPEVRLGVGGAKTKYMDNVAAIRLLQQLQASGAKSATPEEQKILVRYVGWGGLPQVFDPKNEQWAAEYREMQGLLAPDIYAAARRSTQDAHYTSEAVIRGIYEGLSRLGLGTGEPLRILEPSAGIGNFIGLCPEQFNAKFLAVELDPTTSNIAQYLYPKARHFNNSFQSVGLNSPHFDLIVGNPPFGNQSLYDPDFPELRKFSIHNYFLAKSISLLREGGVAAFVVSRFFLDAADPTTREHIAGQADLLGAIRLPHTAFRQNALTDVTADIVFFQRHNGENKRSRDWVTTGSDVVDDLKHGGSRQAVINNYFLRNPGQIIGRMVFDGGMYEGALSCVSGTPPGELGPEIVKRLEALPADCFVPREESPLNTEVRVRNADFLRSPYFQALKNGALCVEPQSRKIVFKVASAFGESDYDLLSVKNETARLRLAGMIQIRDTLRELLNEEKSDGDESRMTSLRIRLNSQYDAFVKNMATSIHRPIAV